MRKGLKIAIIAAIACALAFAILVIFGMNGERKRQLTCGGVNVEFADGYNFVTQEDIEGYLSNEYGASSPRSSRISPGWRRPGRRLLPL